MLLVLISGMAFCYPLYLDSFTNKPIRISLAGNRYFLASELVRDFGANPFRMVNTLGSTDGYNTRVQINRDGAVFKLRIGNSWMCRRQKELVKCGDNVEFWNISKSGGGFTISQKSFCLSAGAKDRLTLEKCGRNKSNSLFLFEDVGIEGCLDSIDLDSKPRTEAEMVKQLALKKRLKDLEKSDKDAANRIKDKLGEKNDFDKYAEKNLPDLAGKEDIKEVLGRLWDYNWRRPKFGRFGYSLSWFGFPFCKKLW